MNKENLNVSIVLYNPNFDEIQQLVSQLNKCKHINNIYLVDNSEKYNSSFCSCDAIYIFNNKNIGFGAGHNIAIRMSLTDGIKYHLVMNYDVGFSDDTIDKLYERMSIDLSIGLIMPAILNSDGTYQILPKLLPSPFDIFLRICGSSFVSLRRRISKYTMEGYYSRTMNVPIISGCFSMFRVEALSETGLFDENFFMYFEDFDISRRIHLKYQTLYYPKVAIVHEYQRGAMKNIRLFFVFIRSFVYYFRKWGWFFDSERRMINENALKQFNL